MTTQPEDRLEFIFEDEYEGSIGYDVQDHKYSVTLNHRLHWFDSREEAEEYLAKA